MPVGESQKQLIAAVLQDKIDVFTFTSSMIVRNFLEIAEDLGIKDKLIEKMNQNTVAAIGEPTAECLRAHGVEVDVLPKRFTFGDMLEELG
jgi:uroporphyrinogen-III synthase